MASQYIPKEYICCISQQIMDFPYCCRCGHTFERVCIVEWLNQNDTCPVSREYLNISQLHPNLALKNLIEDFKRKNPDYDTMMCEPDALQAQASQEENQTQYIQNPELILIDVQTNIFKTENNMIIKLFTQNVPQRMPVNICCAIDVSGSMSINADIQGIESLNLSRLDIVKHALNTILESLTEQDVMSLVSFNKSSKIIFSNKQMTPENKNICKSLIKNLTPNGPTNIWAGLKSGVDVLNCQDNRLKTLFLLTDGCPTERPANQNEASTLKRYIDRNDIKCTVNVFGFGYDLDSKMLYDIGIAGNGTYAFIPDAGFIGTIFTNALANLLSTVATHTNISIKYTNNSITNNQYCSLLYQQDKTIVVPFDASNVPSEINVSCINPYTLEKITCVYNFNELEERELDNNTYENIIRTKFVNSLATSMIKKNSNDIEIFLDNTQNISEFIDNLIKDASGQAAEAFFSEYFNKWGKHYILSLQMAHMYQLCNNFKDPGIQNYMGEFAQNLRQDISDIFDGLPAPQPEQNIYAQGQLSQASQASQRPQISMSVYNNSGGGCFHGLSVVTMEDDKLKYVKDIKIGDILFDNVVITHVVKTKLLDGETMFVEISPDLIITPWHPIFVGNKWIYPCDIDRQKLVKCEYVYNFVTNKRQSILVGNTICCTLGHNLTDNKAISHKYFGTQQVIDDLDKMKKNDMGEIELSNDCYIRDINTNLVIKMKQ